MDLKQTWNEVLNALREEMPRASFDTWVRDTQPVSCAGGTLTVAVRNAYAREWLTERLTHSVERLLAGMSGQETAVHFVVADEAGAEYQEQDEAAESDDIEIAAEEYASLYERVVRPEQAVYLPGYFRRWLPHLGPELAWFYVGFRQAAYWAGGRRGVHSGRFSGRQVAALCGVTERTFWNRVGREATWGKLNGLIRKEGQRYAVAMTLPLTGRDAWSLSRWLASHVEEYGGAEGVLDAACRAPIEDLFAGSHDSDDSDGFPPMSIPHLIQQVFPDLPEAGLKAAAERLRMHLMPQSDQIVVSLFFLEHVLPHLGAGPAWVYVLLRDRCYVGTDHERDTVHVPGGYREIASWLGVSRPRTVYDWLRAPIACIYLDSSSKGEGRNSNSAGWESAPLSVRVLLNDVPPEIVQSAAAGRKPTIDAIFSAHCRDFQSSLTRFSVPIDANFSPSLTRFSVFIDAIFSALKPLNLDSKPIKPGKTPTNPPARQDTSQDSGAVVGVWDLERLLEINVTSPKIRGRLRGGSGEALVSWLLYALSPEGAGIERPWNFALNQMARNPRRGAGGKYDRLAAAVPGDLLEIARIAAKGLNTLVAPSEHPLSGLWLDVMGIGSGARALTLLRLLLGEDAPLQHEHETQAEAWRQTADGAWEHTITIEREVV